MLPANLLPSVVRWHSTTTEDLFAMENRSTHEPRLASELSAHRDLDDKASHLTDIPVDQRNEGRGSTTLPTLRKGMITNILQGWGQSLTPDQLAALSFTVNAGTTPNLKSGGRPRKIHTWHVFLDEDGHSAEFDILAAAGALHGSEVRRNQFITTPQPGIDKRGTYSVGNDAAIGALPQKIDGCICDGVGCSGHGYRQSRPVNVQTIGETATQPYSEATIGWALAGLLIGNPNA